MNKRKDKSLKPMNRSSLHKLPRSFYTPFEKLDQLFARGFSNDPKHYPDIEPPGEKTEIIPPVIEAAADDDSLFQSAMADVSPAAAGTPQKSAAPAP